MSGTVALRLRINSKEAAGGAAVSARGLQVVAAATSERELQKVTAATSGRELQVAAADGMRWQLQME